MCAGTLEQVRSSNNSFAEFLSSAAGGKVAGQLAMLDPDTPAAKQGFRSTPSPTRASAADGGPPGEGEEAAIEPKAGGGGGIGGGGGAMKLEVAEDRCAMPTVCTAAGHVHLRWITRPHLRSFI